MMLTHLVVQGSAMAMCHFLLALTLGCEGGLNAAKGPASESVMSRADIDGILRFGTSDLFAKSSVDNSSDVRNVKIHLRFIN